MDGTSAKSVAHLVPVREDEDEYNHSHNVGTETRRLQLTSNVLVAGASQHGVHGVPHLVEEVLHHAGAEQGGGALGGLGQAQHQHHNRKLVLAHFLAPAAPADGEVTVLGDRGGAGMWCWAAMMKVQVRTSAHPKGPHEALGRSHLVRFILPLEKVAVDVSQQAFCLVDHGLKQTW